jgi:hypothetical protein
MRDAASEAGSKARVNLSVVSTAESGGWVGPMSDVKRQPITREGTATKATVRLALDENRRVPPIKINALACA